MPEGHTIHRLAADLGKDLAKGPVKASSPQGRFDDGAALVDGDVLERASAFGKHLFLEWASANVVHVHLGLIGKFRRRNVELGPRTENIRLRLENDQKAWELAGPNTCAVITPDEAKAVTDKLGPDPLRRSGTAEKFIDRLSRKRVAIGAALLDQSVIAGIGNVYRAELLFLHGIHPLTPSNTLAADHGEPLWNSTVDLLRLGKKLNRIVTVDHHEAGYGTAAKIPKGERLYVYKREGQPCRLCGDEIQLIEIGQRKTWFCPTHQEH